ncbi:hypothetical protein [Gordonia terrae]|uniref:hypothetical protein n=1 Tax=Gordonia terrae TaxID=2055 RepID=UPI003F6B2FBA
MTGESGPQAWLSRPVRTWTYERVDFFERCPQCGHHATATVVGRCWGSRKDDRVLHVSCGRPCGWAESKALTESADEFL